MALPTQKKKLKRKKKAPRHVRVSQGQPSVKVFKLNPGEQKREESGTQTKENWQAQQLDDTMHLD